MGCIGVASKCLTFRDASFRWRDPYRSPAAAGRGRAWKARLLLRIRYGQLNLDLPDVIVPRSKPMMWKRHGSQFRTIACVTIA
jgi:hypothetical protein